MKNPKLNQVSLLIFGFIFLIIVKPLFADNGYDLWLKYQPTPDMELISSYQNSISSLKITGTSETCAKIKAELKRGLSGLLGKEIPINIAESQNGTLLISTPENSRIIKKYKDTIESLGPEGFLVKQITEGKRKIILVTAQTDIGLLYGAFHLLRLMQTGQTLEGLNVVSTPKIQYRLLNHWDNLNRTVERGYAGKSLWKWDELPETVDPRYEDYARANASLGINGTVLNNVNANPKMLLSENLKKVARLADIFRPYGIRVFLSINFSSPISTKFMLEQNRRGGIGDLETSDPLNPEVRKWWKNKVDEIYRLIPDFGGFLVKANSEGMPGPQEYGRTHADGANMLAEALAPHGGIVMWRAFVYVPDTDPDRAKRAYKEFVPLDGKFSPNVFVQAKNGPVDFQPREPVQPLFGAMPATPQMLELQITQEYLGHSTHLVYLAPMWKEYFEFDTYAKGKGSTLARIVDGSLYHSKITGIAGVTNIGSDTNWCGHFFAQANWYAYGRLAWDHSLSSEEIANEWIKMSLTQKPEVLETVKKMMLGSWGECINYTTPLGLHHIMQAGFHYGPQPSFSQSRPDWTSVYYHRADEAGLGFDRTTQGSNAVSQYFPPLNDIFNNIETCPEKYLLWFHHVPWDYKLKSGQTLWDALCLKYDSGTAYVTQMKQTWESLEQEIDPEIFAHVQARLAKHEVDAREWRDVCVDYFQKFSKRPVPGK